MASTTEIIIKKFKALEGNVVKFEEVTGRPSPKTYSFFGELISPYTKKDAIDSDELIPLLSGQNIGSKKR